MARRFAIVCPNYYPRTCGVGDHSARLGQELIRRGFETKVFSRAPAEPHAEASEVPIEGAAGPFPFQIAHRLASAIADYRPTDVIFQFTNQMWDAWRFGSLAPVWLAWRCKRLPARLIVLAHEPFVPFAARPDLALAGAAQRLQFMSLVRLADCTLVTTGTRARTLAPLFRLANVALPSIVRVGPNALPVVRVRPPGVEHAAWPRLGYFSTASVGKRFDVVIDAFTRIAAELPHAELILLGDLGPPDRPSVIQIREAIARHPARDRIRVTGKLSLAQIASTIAELDIYLFPMNTGANTRSGTLPVALGSGLPVVAVHGPETDDDVFRDGENIVFARALEGEAFADATLGLIRDRSRLAQVAAGARRLFDEQISWPRIADVVLAA